LQRLDDAEKERLRLVAELQKQTVWADESAPFSPSEVQELLAENARLKQWDDEQKQVLIAMATKVYLAGYKGDGLVDGVKWLADENARLREELEAKKEPQQCR